ncbi:DUF3017 domain-containing protein [Janibacter terrae]|jgi:hypothetical protein|uniref:DUF3017 domain-containing protein n=1 Tax=Janibacter terrae TaxID=103817 RepID=A0ABZ2FCM1_9MICO|nr:DUF3017 domain-containing protein [Janibacter terrae]MBA4083440.1 DUF3017 domain-containing protein [Kytococcus sp.]
MTGPGEREHRPTAPARPALDVRPLAAWWLIAGGLAVALLFILTDHVLRATLACAGSLLLAAVLRVTLPGSRAGGIAVRGPLVDVVTLVVLAVAVLVAGFSLDLTAR